MSVWRITGRSFSAQVRKRDQNCSGSYRPYLNVRLMGNRERYRDGSYQYRETAGNPAPVARLPSGKSSSFLSPSARFL
jgi:hypothetical protein